MSTSSDRYEFNARPHAPEFKANQRAVIVIAPILPGKAEAWRRFIQELAGSRRAEYEASRRRLGIRGERVWISETRQRVIGILLIETEHPEGTLAALAASPHAFDGWFREQLLALQGFDLTRPNRDYLPDLVLAWQGGEENSLNGPSRLVRSQSNSITKGEYTMSSTETNKAIARRYREIYNSNNMDVLEEVLAADFIPHNMMPGLPPGLEGVRALQQGTMATWPDMHVITEALIAEGDLVVERWTQTMTHTGAAVFGAPANSGKKVRVTGMSIYRIANGKIVEHWAEMDFHTVLAQLDVIPAPGA